MPWALTPASISSAAIRWERGEVSVAQEHFSSNVLRGRLLGLARGWGNGTGPTTVLACAPGELHDLPLLVFGLAALVLIVIPGPSVVFAVSANVPRFMEVLRVMRFRPGSFERTHPPPCKIRITRNNLSQRSQGSRRMSGPSPP